MADFHKFPGLSFRWDPREPLPPHLIRQTSGLGPQSHNLHDLTAYQVGNGQLLKEKDSVVENAGSGKKHNNFNVLLPPSSSKISAQIVHDTATITITHSFENKSTVHLGHARYQFPLPHAAAVVDFTCCIGDSTVLRGTVKPKDEAKRAFDNAVRRRRPAGLLEQDGCPEIFKMSLGNIEAGARVRTELTVIMLLKHDFIPAKSVTQTTFSIPMYIAPRYGPAPTEILETGPRGPETTFSVQIDVLSAEEIINIHSDTHQIHSEPGAGRRKCQRWAEFLEPQKPNESTSAMVRLAQDIACLDKDFVLSVITRPDHNNEVPIACLETHPSLANHGALMVTLPPKFMLRDTTSIPDSEIVFLADRSGSMEDKIDGLKSAMEFFIRGIPEGRLFNIWCFGSSYTSLWTHSRAFAQETMTEALRYVSNGFKADMGGTELLTAIQAVVDVRDRTKAMDLVVLTDGEVWGLEETISFVRTSTTSGNRPVRYFALGIGNAVSRALVEGIAEAGGGYAEIIPNAADGHWEDRLVAVLLAALTGHCGTISVELDTVPREEIRKQTGKPLAVQTSPGDLSVLSPFTRSRIFYLFEGGLPESCKSVIVKATDDNGSEVHTTIPVLPLNDKDLKLHRFAVHALLQDLEHRYQEIRNLEKGFGYHYRPSTSSQDLLMLKQEGERLGCKWSLASKWTSFVAVEQDQEIKHEATKTDSRPEMKGKEVAIAPTTPKDDLGLLRPRNLEKQRLLLAPTYLSIGNARVANSGQNTRSIGPVSNEDGEKLPIAEESDDMLESEDSVSDTDESAGKRRRQASRSIRSLSPLVSFPDLPGSCDQDGARASRLESFLVGSSSWALPNVDNAACDILHTPEPSILAPPSQQDMSTPRETHENPSVTDAKSLSLQASIAAADIAAGKAFVKKVVQYQQSSGSFVFPDEDKLKAVIGGDFYSKLINDMRNVPQIIAVTALLLALLETQFKSCRGLWVLVAAKAKAFVESQAGELKLKGATTPAELLAKAQLAASRMSLLDLEEDGSLRGRRDSGEPSELLFAPAV